MSNNQKPLTPAERAELARLEAIVEDGMKVLAAAEVARVKRDELLAKLKGGAANA